MAVVRAFLMVTATAAALAATSAALAGPPPQLQTAKRCVALWNRSSPLARRSSVLRLQPIAAMVVGTGVIVLGPAPRCSVLVMMSNGSWYATETPCKPGSVRWSPLKRIQDDTAARNNLGGGPTPYAHAARVLRQGKLALA